jgi:hypothetical protein
MVLKNKINFITYGDSNYFKYIELNAYSIKRLYPKSKFIIGDAGLTEDQRNSLKKFANVEIISWIRNENLQKYYLTPRRAFFEKLFRLKKINKFFKILLNRLFPNEGIKSCVFKHIAFSKPFFIIKAISYLEEGNLVLLDGDSVLIKRIDEVFEDDFDIGVTLRRKEKLTKKSYDKFEAVNAGILFLKCDNKIKLKFLSEWSEKMLIDIANKEGLADQSSLNRMVFRHYPNRERFKFKKFDGGTYNRNHFEGGIMPSYKILHFKGKDKDKYDAQLKELQNNLKKYKNSLS